MFYKSFTIPVHKRIPESQIEIVVKMVGFDIIRKWPDNKR